MHYYSVIKINECNNMNESNYAEWKKPDGKDYILYDSIDIKFQKMQTYLKRQKTNHGCLRLVVWGWRWTKGRDYKIDKRKLSGVNDCSDYFTVVYLFETYQMYTLNICSLHI